MHGPARSKKLAFGLSAELWIVEAGIFLNYLGWGAVMPFELIYLHEGRGLSLGVAGLVVGVITGLAVVAAPAAGPVIDRFGARATVAGAGAALAAGYASLAAAHTAPQALLAATAAGLGNGALVPAQSTLLAALAPADLRHRATAVSRVASNGGIGLGAALGGLVATGGSGGLAALFVANAVTYVLYALILVATVRRDERLDPLPGGYRLLLHDRPFVHLAVTNVALIAVGWGVFTWIVPPYASEQLGASTRLIGSLLFANAVTVVFAQIPVTRLSEGRRRGPTMAVSAVAFVVACLLVVAAGFLDAAPLLFAAASWLP
jgi:MFS family permease